MSDMTILEQWRSVAYNQNADKNKLQRFWANYFNIEKNIYEQLLENPDEIVSGTVKELAEKYGQDVMTMVGFLDGINESLKEENPIEDLSEKYEYSDDYGMKIIIEKKTGGVNHLICLGAGELAARTVVDLYVDKTGEITEKQAYFGEYEIAETYDYGNSESATELKEKGIEHLKELKSSDSVSASFSKLDVDIGDIVGGRNRATGIVLKEPVTQEIVKIKNGIETITYKVGEE